MGRRKIFSRELLLLTVALASMGLREARAGIDPDTDSVESAGVGVVPGNPTYVGGSTIKLGLVAKFESGGSLTVNSTSGVVWKADSGTIVGDSYTAPSTAGAITDTISGVYYSERFDYFDDKVTATRAISVVPNTSTGALPPASAVFGAPPGGLAVVNVTLVNPFSQALIVDSDSVAAPGGGTSGLGDTTVFDPFANLLHDNRFMLQANSSVSAEVGLGFVSGNSSDQDGAVYLSGVLEDGTPVETPLLPYDLVSGPASLSGTFVVVPEPSALGLTLAGLMVCAIAGGARFLCQRTRTVQATA